MIRATDLRGENFVSLQRGSVFQFRVDEVFDKAGVRRRLRVEASTRQAACDLVAAGAGVAIVGPLFTIETTDRRLLFRPLEPPIYLEHGMLFPAFNPKSLVTERFAKLMVDYTERHFPSEP